MAKKTKKIVELPNHQDQGYVVPRASEPQLQNSIMHPRLKGKNITGRVESLDGLSFLDLDQGRFMVNDGSNDRVLIGKF